MPVFRLGDLAPQLGPDTYLAPTAVLVGDVRLGRGASVWFNAVLRADNDRITVGEESNVQDNCVLHVDTGEPVVLGRGVTVGHGVVLHGCSIGDHTLVGMGSVVLDGARVGRHCLIAAGSLVTKGMEVPDYSLVMGRPAEVKSRVSEEQVASMRRSTAHYLDHARHYLAALGEKAAR